MYTNSTLEMRNQPIESEIYNLRVDTEKSSKEIALGSDEHLDILCDLIDRTKYLSGMMESVIEAANESLNHINDKTIEDTILPLLVDLYISGAAYINLVESLQLASNIEQTLEIYRNKHDNIKEIINDLRLRISKDDEISALMKEIANLED